MGRWWPFGGGRVEASAAVRTAFGLASMEAPRRARGWFEALLRRYPFTAAARRELGRLRFEVGSLTPLPPDTGGPLSASPRTGSDEAGFGDEEARWWPGERLVAVREARDEAGIRALALAHWHTHADAARRAALLAAVERLAEEPAARYAWAATLAGHALHGVRTAAGPADGRAYWRGYLAEGDAGAIFAALAAGTLGDLALLPDEVATFYADLFERPG